MLAFVYRIPKRFLLLLKNLLSPLLFLNGLEFHFVSSLKNFPLKLCDLVFPLQHWIGNYQGNDDCRQCEPDGDV
jgi:hypothetical protein